MNNKYTLDSKRLYIWTSKSMSDTNQLHKHQQFNKLSVTESTHASITREFIVQELCESRGGRPGLSVLTSLLVSVDVKIY